VLQEQQQEQEQQQQQQQQEQEEQKQEQKQEQEEQEEEQTQKCDKNMFEPWCLHVFTCLYHPVFSEFPETCPIRDIDGWREVSELELDVEIGSMAHDSASFDCTHVVVAACLCIYIYICVYIYIRIINIPT